MYINNVLYCFYSSDTEALEACFRLLHDDDDEINVRTYFINGWNLEVELKLMESGLISEVSPTNY